MLIWLISAPVWRWSWKVSESRWAWCEEVAAQVEHHVLLGLRAEVVVETVKPLPTTTIRKRSRTIEIRTTQTSGSTPKTGSTNPVGLFFVEDLVEDHRQRPRLGQAEQRREHGQHDQPDQRSPVRAPGRDASAAAPSTAPRPLSASAPPSRLRLRSAAPTAHLAAAPSGAHRGRLSLDVEPAAAATGRPPRRAGRRSSSTCGAAALGAPPARAVAARSGPPPSPGIRSQLRQREAHRGPGPLDAETDHEQQDDADRDRELRAGRPRAA